MTCYTTTDLLTFNLEREIQIQEQPEKQMFCAHGSVPSASHLLNLSIMTCAGFNVDVDMCAVVSLLLSVDADLPGHGMGDEFIIDARPRHAFIALYLAICKQWGLRLAGTE